MSSPIPSNCSPALKPFIIKLTAEINVNGFDSDDAVQAPWLSELYKKLRIDGWQVSLEAKPENPEYYTPEAASELHVDLKTGVWEEKLFPPLSWPLDPTAPRWHVQDGQWVKTLGKTTA